MIGDAPSTRANVAGEKPAAQSKSTAQIRQIVQHFFTKAALTIVSSRVTLPHCFSQDSGQIRVNKWFNLNLDESEVLSKELGLWATSDIPNVLPPSLFIDIYLDTAELARNQSLVIFDERGRRWDVAEALLPVGETRTSARINQIRNTRVVLEQWKISLGDIDSDPHSASSSEGPSIYKRAIVLFRSLYAYLRFMPAWKFGHRIAKQPASLNSLRPAYRIHQGEPAKHTADPLRTALYPAAESTVETHVFQRTSTMVGPMSIEVTYRTNCDFRLDESDAYLSSQFMGMDDHYFPPSLGDGSRHMTTSGRPAEVGSLPLNANRRGIGDTLERNQAYGSLATFHYAGPAAGTSPISALRAARELASISPTDGQRSKSPMPADTSAQSSRSALRSVDSALAVQRRTSVTFQPFKAGSLSSSPAHGIGPSPLSGNSLPRTSSLGAALAQSRTPSSSQQVGTPRSPLGPGVELGVDLPGSASPKAPPLTRYSSSFSNRRTRISFTTAAGGTTSRSEDDNNSSGRPSPTSSTQPGSGLLTEGEGGSSGNIQTDDDNISDFLKLLEQKKDLKSFNRNDVASRDASARRTTAALSKYRGLRDSHSALTDSLSSSLMLHRSSSSSSRQLSGVPPMLAGTSVSTSSSPGKPISPHTPHTPAIPSRLSANATIDDDIDPELESNRARFSRYRSRQSDEQTIQVQLSGRGSNAIDIPTSPQRYPHVRRSSSANQHPRALEEEFGLRSASLPVDDRPDLTMSEILALQQPMTHNVMPLQSTEGGAEAPRVPGMRDQRLVSSSSESQEVQRALSGGFAGSATQQTTYPSRLGRHLAARGSSSSFGGGSGSSDRPSRYGFGARVSAVDDDEPLLFTMSELGNQSRRSLEEGRGGGNTRGR